MLIRFQKFFIHFPVLLLFSLFTSQITAQKTETYYNYAWKKCDSEKATYYSVTQKSDSGYYRKDYFTNGGKPQMFALFEDSACKIYNGYATFYYANGYPKSVGRYIHNQREGVAVSYHSNGFLSDSGNYRNGLPAGNIYKWHFNGYIADSTALVKDSLFVHVSWFDDGSVASAGREINGKSHGPWVFYRRDGSKAASEMYENGKRMSTKHFDEGGNEIAVDTNRNEHPAEFKGGIKKWSSYLEKVLSWPDGYRFTNTNTVVIKVEMTIDETGKIVNAHIVNPFHPAFDKIAFDAITNGPSWIPAVQHNRPVPYRFVQTVTFSQQ